jgi:four helix bundle protein
MIFENYKKLRVWQQAMDLVLLIYELTDGFPEKEQQIMVTRIRQSAINIPAKIASGSVQGAKIFIKTIYEVYGLVAELETQLKLAERLGYTSSTQDILADSRKVTMMLSDMQRKLVSRLSDPKIAEFRIPDPEVT